LEKDNYSHSWKEIGEFIRDNSKISTNLYQYITKGTKVKTVEEMAYEYGK